VAQGIARFDYLKDEGGEGFCLLEVGGQVELPSNPSITLLCHSLAGWYHDPLKSQKASSHSSIHPSCRYIRMKEHLMLINRITITSGGGR